MPRRCGWTTVAVAATRRLAAGEAGRAYVAAQGEPPEHAVGVRIISEAQLLASQGATAVDEAVSASLPVRE
jgi:hypothetical protein